MLTVKHNTIVPKYIFYSKPSAHHTTRPCQSKRRKRVKPSVNCVMVALCCFTDARLLWQNVKISLPWQHGSFGVQSEWYHYITQPQTRNLPAQISGNFSTDNPHNNPSSVPTISPSELENEHWISVQVQIGDPIRGATWRVVLKQAYFAIADTVAKGDFRTWIAGKLYIPQQKSPRKDKSVGCPLGDGKSVGVAEHFPWPVGWAQTGYPKVP